MGKDWSKKITEESAASSAQPGVCYAYTKHQLPLTKGFTWAIQAALLGQGRSCRKSRCMFLAEQAQKSRAVRYASEVLQSPSVWLLCTSLGTLCPAGICQSHEQLQAKGNCICQEGLREFSLTDDFFCCSIAFLLPLGFLYFVLTASQEQQGWWCMFMYYRLIIPTLFFFSDFISLFQMHLKL